ncbi:MAG: hypothetical protein R3C45_08175 [Phycisphaerales bacterium]
MLSVTQIQKLFNSQDHTRMITSLADNGAALPLPLQARLTQPAATAGLGLRRLTELTYGPTSLSRDMIDALLDTQLPDGSFPGQVDHDPLTTAAAAAGLAATLREQRPAPGTTPGSVPDPHTAQALDHALTALAGMQDGEGLFRHGDDRTEQDRALTSAFVLFLLARLPGFREACRFADLMTWFDERADRLDEDTAQLYHMASLDDPTRHPLSPALNAIAA